MIESSKRSLVKTICWRSIGSLSIALLVFILTKEWALSLGVGGLEGIVKIVLYYLHERAWDRLEWG